MDLWLRRTSIAYQLEWRHSAKTNDEGQSEKLPWRIFWQRVETEKPKPKQHAAATAEPKPKKMKADSVLSMAAMFQSGQAPGANESFGAPGAFDAATRKSPGGGARPAPPSHSEAYTADAGGAGGAGAACLIVSQVRYCCIVGAPSGQVPRPLPAQLPPQLTRGRDQSEDRYSPPLLAPPRSPPSFPPNVTSIIPPPPLAPALLSLPDRDSREPSRPSIDDDDGDDSRRESEKPPPPPFLAPAAAVASSLCSMPTRFRHADTVE